MLALACGGTNSSLEREQSPASVMEGWSQASEHGQHAATGLAAVSQLQWGRFMTSRLCPGRERRQLTASEQLFPGRQACPGTLHHLPDLAGINEETLEARLQLHADLCCSSTGTHAARYQPAHPNPTFSVTDVAPHVVAASWMSDAAVISLSRRGNEAHFRKQSGDVRGGKRCCHQADNRRFVC